MALFNPCMKFEFFLAKAFIWSAMKASFSEFIQNLSQAQSKSLSKWIKVDKWDYLQNPLRELKKIFLFRVPRIPRKTGKQNWRGPIFLRFDLIE